MWELVSTVSVPSGFSSPFDVQSLLFCLCPFLSLCPALSSRIKHNAFSRGWPLLSPSLAGIQTWVSSTTRGLRLTFGGQPLLSRSMSREQGWGPWELIRGSGYSGSSLSSCPSLSLDNLLYSKNFPGLHTG